MENSPKKGEKTPLTVFSAKSVAVDSGWYFSGDSEGNRRLP